MTYNLEQIFSPSDLE